LQALSARLEVVPFHKASEIESFFMPRSRALLQSLPNEVFPQPVKA